MLNPRSSHFAGVKRDFDVLAFGAKELVIDDIRLFSRDHNGRAGLFIGRDVNDRVARGTPSALAGITVRNAEPLAAANASEFDSHLLGDPVSSRKWME